MDEKNDSKFQLNITGNNPQIGHISQGDHTTNESHNTFVTPPTTSKPDEEKLHGTVFISYRRGPSRALVEALYTHLSPYFDPVQGKVFLDVKSLSTGQFPDELRSAVSECDVFICVISEGTFDRIAEPGDWVHTEIKTALETERPILLLLEEDVPFPTNLPADIASLTDWNGMRLRYAMFEACVKHMVDKYLRPMLG